MEAKMRGNGMESAFKETGGPGQKKEREKKANRKKEMLDELITLQLVDDENEPLEGCVFKIMRRRLTFEIIQETVNESPHPCKVDYVHSDTGDVIWIDNLMKEAKKESVYVIVPVVLREPFDICRNPKFDGQTVFAIQYVPFHCRDETTAVDALALKEWLLYAVIEEDPYIPPIELQIEKQKGKIKDVDRKLKSIVKQVFLEDDGTEMATDKAELEREAMFKAVGEERERMETELKRREQLLLTHKEWRRNMGIDLEPAEYDETSNTFMWFAKFHGTEDARDMENLLLLKNDYGGLRLACGSKAQNFGPWVGRSSVPDGTKTFLPDYTMLQVNIAGVRIMRIPHGVGVYKSMDRQSLAIADDYFYYFYGNWYAGKKLGFGVEVNDSGIYAGRFVDNWKDGQGQWDIANGGTIKGNFGKVESFKEINPSLNPDEINPYLDGEPSATGVSGEFGGPPQTVEVLFADGGFYRGAMKDGIITGKGQYESAFGEVLAGNFKNGMLHDDEGYYLNHNREEYKGRFDHGEMHGYMTYKHPKGDTFRGYYDHSLRNGRGEAQYKNKGIYRGYYVNGFRHGKGEIDYCKRDMGEYFKLKKKLEKEHQANMAKQQSQQEGDVGATTGKGGGGRSGDKEEILEEVPLEEVVTEYHMRFQGHSMSDQIFRGSGTVMDTMEQVPRVLSIQNKKRMDPINSFIRKVAQKNKRNKRLMEKLTDMEIYIRKEIIRKKSRIFRQQRHYTKKSIYDTEIYGPIEEILIKSRHDMRLNRMARIKKMKASNSSTAINPRLRNIPSSELNLHLDKVFTHVQPEAGSQDVETMHYNLPIVRTIISDFAEIKERARFLKYDSMMERAEQAFASKKREDAS